jgi:hypothetical protein
MQAGKEGVDFGAFLGITPRGLTGGEQGAEVGAPAVGGEDLFDHPAAHPGGIGDIEQGTELGALAEAAEHHADRHGLPDLPVGGEGEGEPEDGGDGGVGEAVGPGNPAGAVAVAGGGFDQEPGAADTTEPRHSRRPMRRAPGPG